MIVIFVNKDCPLDKLTFEQVDAIFGSTRKLGGKKDIVTWGDLGLDRRLGRSTNQPLWPQLFVGHLRIRQERMPRQRGLQVDREGTVGAVREWFKRSVSTSTASGTVAWDT